MQYVYMEAVIGYQLSVIRQFNKIQRVMELHPDRRRRGNPRRLRRVVALLTNRAGITRRREACPYPEEPEGTAKALPITAHCLVRKTVHTTAIVKA